ncbi:unnamed protein product [Debaryomyces tyrocola]|nr:unnamed protein product [Debaryomyces tyrocola]
MKVINAIYHWYQLYNNNLPIADKSLRAVTLRNCAQNGSRIIFTNLYTYTFSTYYKVDNRGFDEYVVDAIKGSIILFTEKAENGKQ